jgi:hypothetical protein
LLVQKKRNKEKDTFLKVFFDLQSKTEFIFPKFSPRLQKFLTERKFYTAKKIFLSIRLGNVFKLEYLLHLGSLVHQLFHLLVLCK